MPAHLSISSLSKSFGTTAVLRSISAAIAPGEFVTLLGPSGCGKTTLLRILAGLETPDAGAIALGETDLLALPARVRPINMVFQSYSLFPHLRVFDNVAFGLRSRGIDAAAVNQKVSAALDLLQIADLAKRKPDQLSGGQRQRVALARALVNEPELLLLDEPMSALDAKLRAEVQVELRRLQRALGRTFILVTHDQDEALIVSDRILLMNAGQIEQQGTPAEIYNHPRTRFTATFLGAANLIPVTHVDGRTAATPLGPLMLPSSPAWTNGHLAIRPEHLRLHASAPASMLNVIPATLEESIFRGDHHDLRTAPINGQSLRLRLPATLAQPDSRAPLYIELPPAAIQILTD